MDTRWQQSKVYDSVGTPLRFWTLMYSGATPEGYNIHVCLKYYYPNPRTSVEWLLSSPLLELFSSITGISLPSIEAKHA